MKISSIPQIYRNVNRLTEIISVLSKYGLADGISFLGPDFVKDLIKNRDGEALARRSRETRIRMAIEELGPTFIKLGQILSTRPDLVGPALARELETLQEHVACDPIDVVRQTVADDLGHPIEELFAFFAETPLASASIGQAHRATLPSGEEVVVKVQHAGIQERVRRDLDVLAGIAQLMERLPEWAPYHPTETVAEFQRSLRRELDFRREERNLSHFSLRFRENPHIQIPRPISELCSGRVLTMDYLQGTKLSQKEQLDAMELDRQQLAMHGADLYMEMVFGDGFFHADPHPGNLVVLPDGRIGLLDFGMVGRVEERLREEIEDLLLAVVNQDSEAITSILIRIAEVPGDMNEATLRLEVVDFVTHYGNQPLERLELARALEEMIAMIFHYRIVLPAQVALMLKVFITLEGTAQLLCPHFSLVQVLQRYQRKALLRRLSPARRMRKLRRIVSEVEQLMEILPRRTLDILTQIKAGKFDVHLDHRGLEPSVNRLALALLASSLFMGSALLLSQEVPPILFPEKSVLGLHNVSILGFIGCLVSVLLGLRLLRAIGKSGHLDRRD